MERSILGDKNTMAESRKPEKMAEHPRLISLETQREKGQRKGLREYSKKKQYKTFTRRYKPTGLKK